MTSKIKVDNINKVSDDSNIINKCGTTITLGASGDTINLASGASQTGFGRTGTVDWQTGDIKTVTFTAVSGKGYFCNTTASGFTMNLPTSPSAGDIVGVRDYANTFSNNNLTIGRGGSLLESNAGDKVLDQRSQEFLMVYVDGVQGWIATSSGTGSVGVNPTFIAASGGCTVTTSGNYKIHKFCSPGTLTVTSVGNCAGSNTVSYVVVASGGGGGAGNGGGGGGGAGGYRESKASSDSYTASSLNATSGPGYNIPVSVTPGSYPIVVGGGGAGTPGGVGNSAGASGNTSSFSTISSAGGGGGSGSLPTTAPTGGSGGGAGGPGCAVVQAGGVGNTPPTSPPQGQPGGIAGSPSGANNQGGGGGGAGGAGEDVRSEGPVGIPASTGGNGGLGVTSEITASSIGYAGGGGGNNERSTGIGAGKGGYGPQPAPDRNTTPGAGGLGCFGAGNGSFGAAIPGNNTNASDNLGGGGGGIDAPQSGKAGNGGSGVVIIRYKYQ